MKNLILIDLGFTFGLPTIIIPALTGIRNVHNQNEALTITAEQATWIGKGFPPSLTHTIHTNYIKLKYYREHLLFNTNDWVFAININNRFEKVNNYFRIDVH